MAGGAKRRAKTLYNHPVSSVVDNFVVNLGGSVNRIHSESGGRLEYKLNAKVGGIEEAVKNGSDLGELPLNGRFQHEMIDITNRRGNP